MVGATADADVLAAGGIAGARRAHPRARRRGSGTSSRPPSPSTGGGGGSGRTPACGTAASRPTSPSSRDPRASPAAPNLPAPMISAPTPGSCSRRNVSSSPRLPPGVPTSSCHQAVSNIHSCSRSPAWPNGSSRLRPSPVPKPSSETEKNCTRASDMGRSFDRDGGAMALRMGFHLPCRRPYPLLGENGHRRAGACRQLRHSLHGRARDRAGSPSSGWMCGGPKPR